MIPFVATPMDELTIEIAPDEILLPRLVIILVLKSVRVDWSEPKLISYLVDISDRNTEMLLIKSNICSYNSGTVRRIIIKSEPIPRIQTVRIANHFGEPASTSFFTSGYIT